MNYGVLALLVCAAGYGIYRYSRRNKLNTSQIYYPDSEIIVCNIPRTSLVSTKDRIVEAAHRIARDMNYRKWLGLR